MRRKIDFNEGWTFRMGEPEGVDLDRCKTGVAGGASNLTGGEGFTPQVPQLLKALMGENAGVKIYNLIDKLEEGWQPVSLPHDWTLESDYIPPNSGDWLSAEPSADYKKGGVACYRKRFALGEEYSGMRVFLEFDGVMRDTALWVNGSYIGGHFSGYTGFGFDISENLRFGKEPDNVILLRTDTTRKEGWWGEGGGIYRDVSLNLYPSLHYARHGIFVHTGSLSEEKGQLIIQSCITNESENAKSFVHCHSLLTPQGIRIPLSTSTGEVKPLETVEMNLETEIISPELWSMETAVLYTLESKLYQGEILLDCVETGFGIRSAEYRKDGFYLNGRLTELKGVCMHQDFAGVGIALPEDIIDFRILKLKEMGANAIRSAHHPASPRLLEACDRLGMLVLNENRHFECNPEGISDLQELICSARNHPCIFSWCLENEEFVSSGAMGERILKRMISYVKKWDPSRQLTIAGQFSKENDNYMLLPDITGLNYDYDDAQRMKDKYPEIKVMATESVSFPSTRGEYEDSPEKGFCTCYDSGSYYLKLMKMENPDIDFGTLGGALGTMQEGGMLPFSWLHFRNDMPALGGVFLWAGFDYRGESFPWYWPAKNSQYGAMDQCGFEKDSFYYWQSVWCEEAVIHALPHWTWPEKEGKVLTIEVYSNCEEIELLINNVSQGRKKHQKGSISNFEVVYSPGELKLIGYMDKKETVAKRFVTAGKPHQVSLSKVYDGNQYVLVEAAVKDESGTVCPVSDLLMECSATGGRFIGSGNGNPSSDEKDTSPIRTIFNGKVLFIIKRQGHKEMSIQVQSDGLQSGEIII